MDNNSGDIKTILQDSIAEYKETRMSVLKLWTILALGLILFALAAVAVTYHFLLDKERFELSEAKDAQLHAKILELEKQVAINSKLCK